MYPLFIPSKERSSTCILCHNLKKTNREFYIFIYSEDYAEYKKYFTDNQLIIVPNNIKGITAKRQYMLNLAKKRQIGWFWMADDDIHKFYYRPNKNYNGKLINLSLENFLEKCELFTEILYNNHINNVFQIGFKKGAFGLLKSSITINTDIGEIHLLNTNCIKDINYDQKLIALEDTDFSIQNILNGAINIKLNDLIFYAPKSGSGVGGLENVYLNSGKNKGIKQFQEKYGKLISVDKKKKNKYRIRWKIFQNTDLESKIEKLWLKI